MTVIPIKFKSIKSVLLNKFTLDNCIYQVNKNITIPFGNLTYPIIITPFINPYPYKALQKILNK